MADESAYLSAGIVVMLMSQISAGVAQVPMLGSYASIVVGIIMLGAAVWLAKQVSLNGVEGIGKMLVALGVALVAAAMLPVVGGFVAGFSAYGIMAIALGIVLMYVKLAKRAI